MDQLERHLSRAALRLQKNGEDLDFFALLRSVELLRPELPRLGCAADPGQEAVRLGQLPYLHFPKTTVSGIVRSDRRPELYLILVYFFGLCGVNGPLPLELTGLIHQRSNNQYDHALRRFLDIFNHRLLTLFYRAFARNELSVSFDRKQDDSIGAAVRALSGVQVKTSLPQYSAESMVGSLMRPERGAAGLKVSLKRFFGHEFAVSEYVRTKSIIPAEARCRLGRANTTLGRDAQLGRHFYTCTQALSLSLEPLPYRKALNFMPGGAGFAELSAIVRLYLKRPLTVFFTVTLQGDTIPDLYLGRRFRLSRSAFLQQRRGRRSDRSVCFKLRLQPERSAAAA